MPFIANAQNNLCEPGRDKVLWTCVGVCMRACAHVCASALSGLSSICKQVKVKASPFKADAFAQALWKLWLRNGSGTKVQEWRLFLLVWLN